MRKRVHNASKTKDSSTMTKKRLTANKRTELIDTIIANVCCFDENDRTILNSLSDDKLLRMAHEGELEPSNNKKEAVANADVENKKKAKDDDPCAKEGMTAEEVQNCKEKQKMAANALTPEQLEDLAFAKQVKQERKDAAIAVITANKQNPWKAEELQAMPLDQLQKLATIAKVDAPAPLPKVLPNFRGAAVPATNAGNDQEDKDDMLPLPTINWGEWAASKN